MKIETIELQFKWIFSLGILLALIITICFYGYIPAPIPFLARTIHFFTSGYGIYFSFALFHINNKLPEGAITDEFYDLFARVIGLFLFYIVDIMSQKIALGDFN